LVAGRNNDMVEDLTGLPRKVIARWFIDFFSVHFEIGLISVVGENSS